MTFEHIDKRFAQRKDLPSQEKYFKDCCRHLADATDKFDTIKIEHEPICLLQNKSGQARQAPAAEDSTPDHPED